MFVCVCVRACERGGGELKVNGWNIINTNVCAGGQPSIPRVLPACRSDVCSDASAFSLLLLFEFAFLPILSLLFCFLSCGWCFISILLLLLFGFVSDLNVSQFVYPLTLHVPTEL